MTIGLGHLAIQPGPLTPVTAALRAMFGTDDLPGLARGLLLDDPTGWIPATELADGSRMSEFLTAAAARWQGTPHACAALAWKSYSYWLALPVVLGWATARRVPLLDPADVLIRFDGPSPITVGLRPSVRTAVLTSDPLALGSTPQPIAGDGSTVASARNPGVRVVPDEDALLNALRASLLDGHLTPVRLAIQSQVRVGARTLLGSVASGVAQGILRASDVLPGSSVRTIDTLLETLDLADLVELVPGADGRPTVQRRTCCLAFTLPNPKICADCCVRPD